MAQWYLIIKTGNGDYDIKIGPDKDKALEVLQDAGSNIGASGRVTIAERLVLDAKTIYSAMIELRAS